MITDMLLRSSQSMGRRALIFAHDIGATAVALFLALHIRFADHGLAERIEWLYVLVPIFILYAGGVYWLSQLHRAKWRFASLPDLFNIFRAATILAVTLLVVDYILIVPNLYGTFFFGKIAIALYWLLQIFLLGAPRFAYRYFRYTRTRHHSREAEAVPVLLAGRAVDADVFLRGVESGAINKVWPVGLISPSPADHAQAVRGLPVLGRPRDLERVINDLSGQGVRVARVVLLPTALASDSNPEAILMQARKLGVPCSRMQALASRDDPIRLAPIAVEDLLLRPTVEIDHARLKNLVQGKAFVVTGGGGSIGSELCRRLVAFGAARLLVIENSELALHSILEELTTAGHEARVAGHIADIRDRARLMSVVSEFRPDLVFHAAALKHVPLLEMDWEEGIKTNIFGSVNVADAAIAAEAVGVVMISTDKAIEPVSMLGATKRFAEMYGQALDAHLARRANGGSVATRIVSVRFGNVLASTGSVVPKFKAQIEAGGPVTITHPDMVRYFMTGREASDLVLTAASHSLGESGIGVSIYELNMGQPVRIQDLAERMIRLSGFEPGRDIEIAYTGIRPGERLHEYLSAHEERCVDIGIAGVVGAKPEAPSLDDMRTRIQLLEQGLLRDDRTGIYRVLGDAVPAFRMALAERQY